jgi:peroxiredoxin
MEKQMSLSVGTKAPNFTLKDTELNSRSLSDFAGKPVVLAFVPAAFSGVCSDEICTFENSLSTLNTLDTSVLVINVDNPFANKAWAKANNVSLPILSDPTLVASKAYDTTFDNFVGIEGFTVSNRSVYVLNKDHEVVYAWTGENPGVAPNFEEVMASVNAL